MFFVGVSLPGVVMANDSRYTPGSTHHQAIVFSDTSRRCQCPAKTSRMQRNDSWTSASLLKITRAGQLVMEFMGKAPNDALVIHDRNMYIYNIYIYIYIHYIYIYQNMYVLRMKISIRILLCRSFSETLWAQIISNSRDIMRLPYWGSTGLVNELTKLIQENTLLPYCYDHERTYKDWGIYSLIDNYIYIYTYIYRYLRT